MEIAGGSVDMVISLLLRIWLLSLATTFTDSGNMGITLLAWRSKEEGKFRLGAHHYY